MTDIAQFMSDDHDRLDALFGDFRKQPDDEKARALFSQFAAGLRAHIAWEEEILFPPFEERTGMGHSGPTAVMRAEHQQIKLLLQAIGQRIEQRYAAKSTTDLLAVLTAHNQKEEQVLYPWLNRSLGEGEKSALLARIKAAPGG